MLIWFLDLVSIIKDVWKGCEISFAIRGVVGVDLSIRVRRFLVVGERDRKNCGVVG